MMSMSSVYTRSDAAGSMHASGMGYPYGPLDGGHLNCFIDDAQLYDFRLPLAFPSELDQQFLLLNQPQVFSHSEVSFSSSLCQSWPEEPFPGQFLMSEMEFAQAPAREAPPSGGSARSCSPASDSSTLSDVSLASGKSFGGQSTCATQSQGSAGPSRAVEPPLGLPLPSSVGPVRRGRGRPRKDAPPVHQPPPLCTYIDPLTGTPCNKLLNRHHDLPRHMFKHCQEEAALVNSGRLAREHATLLPDDWKQSDELKLPCRFCSQRFSRADAVKRHEKKEHKHRPRKG